MNIYMQICGIALLIVLLVLFSTKREKLFLNTEKIYIIILIVTLFTNATQIVCQFLLDDSSVPIVIKYIGCNVYQLLLVLTLCCAMMYVSRDIFVDRKEFMKKSWSYIILFCIAAFVISLTPEKLQLEGNYLYAYGLGVYVTYVFALVFIIAILIRVNVNSRKMNVDHRS